MPLEKLKPQEDQEKRGEYDDDMSFGHCRDWAKKYKELRDL